MNILNTTTRLTGRVTGSSVRTMATIINKVSEKATPRLNAIAKEFKAGYNTLPVDKDSPLQLTQEQWAMLKEMQSNTNEPVQGELY